MKIFDCITYYNEPLLFEIRLNVLDKFVDKFIVVESNFTHSGQKKHNNFDKLKYPKFKDKILHVCLDKDADNIKLPEKTNRRENSIKRISFQRNSIINFLSEADKDDWIIYSDSDEIPNLNDVNFKKEKSKIIFFNQKLFYYKFDLHLPSVNWFGSRAIKLKNLKTISQLRNAKPKKYNWWRIDILFSNLKYKNIKILSEGGWHFSDLKSVEEIYKKKQNDEHHDEFQDMNIKLVEINDMVKNKYITYNHLADKKDIKKRWSNKIKLKNIELSNLPKYLQENKSKYFKWFDK